MWIRKGGASFKNFQGLWVVILVPLQGAKGAQLALSSLPGD